MDERPKRRRNGRMQACDPCRSRKVSCDHTWPVCRRCRKGSHQCVYTASQPSVPLPKELTASPSALATTLTPHPVEAVTQPSSIATGTLIGLRSTNWAATGYLGYTSYSTVIKETLSILNSQPEENHESVPAGSNQVNIPRHVLQLAVTVLGHIPDVGNALRLLRQPKYMDTWIFIIATRILESLYREYGAFLGKDRSLSELQNLAQKICLNTAKPTCDNTSSANEWLAQFEGANIRWESLGLLFNFWDLQADPANPEHSMSQIRPLAKYYSPAAHECLIRCIDLSHEFSKGNVLLLYLHYRQTNTATLVFGDAGCQVWRSHAATISALTFFGIHAETTKTPYRPTLQSEAKRRVLAAIIAVDKELAVFTGRMPLLNPRFTTSPLPLDLKDEYLFMDNATLFARAQDTLDDEGWNLEGEIYSSTHLRAGLVFARLREQIIDMTLDHDMSTASIADIMELKTQQADIIASLPKILIYTPDDTLDQSLEPKDFHARFAIRLECLHNEFYTDRLLLRKGHINDGSLLATSYDMLMMVTNGWTNADRFSRIKANIGWMSICYGASAGGVLCKELLQPTFSDQHPKNPAITRSSIIQVLSLFVGCLEWVTLWGSNRDLCMECKSVLQRVLDFALNTENPTQQLTSTIDWDFPVPLNFNFDLLETFDYLRPETQTL